MYAGPDGTMLVSPKFVNAMLTNSPRGYDIFKTMQSGIMTMQYTCTPNFIYRYLTDPIDPPHQDQRQNGK